ncbi:hypothetical protein FHS61_002353 [Altererythrobacter atlanticus]|uniref:Uncharacterized protein n=1 Tax=Croceibacterium atlanticum TaxID=1267766 RepID=A0A0F7KS58_9SPHN|nr:murein L,D-transpeptidase catalytic domain family protein [Croceibacterium atlanticum]AKH42112.1 hypothetical protein WYH_01065 [Croceibacterium atlanticum]MBB5733318.1 hypothetical protein [Croceibacterium atlanticum]
MTFDRRRFIGASLAAGVSLVAAPRAFAAPRLANRPPHLSQAMAALDRHGSRIKHRDTFGIVDFAAKSGEMRFHIVDAGNGRIVESLFVAHGRGSDPANTGMVQRFSNRPGSNASSEGAFLTGAAYYGKHGRSRRLHGLEPQNDAAFDRAIVIHGADYVDRTMADRHGRVGRSLGCFTVEQRTIGTVLDRLGSGRLLFAAK